MVFATPRADRGPTRHIMIVLFLAAFAMAVFDNSNPCSAFFTLDPTTRRWKDPAGRERIFHGMNVVSKGPPYAPDPTGTTIGEYTFNEADMQLFHDYGFNAMRLGVMWPGVEPKRRQFNTTYLANARHLMQTAAKYNISTVVDVHQDVASGYTCGEGMPLWAAKVNDSLMATFPEPFGPPLPRDPVTGVVNQTECDKHSWSDYQVTFEGAATYQQLYDSVTDNPNGMREEFAYFWSAMASEFANVSSVIGYELINEPFAGNVWKDPLLWVPWIADKQNLQPFYDTVASAIHKVDPNHVVMFESVTWASLPIIHSAKLGFDHPPGGSQYALKSALSFHYYDPPNVDARADYFNLRTEAAKDLGIGAFVTEFEGSTTDNGPNSTLAVLDQHLLSWTAWDYKSYRHPGQVCTGCGPAFFFPNGTINEAVLMTLSRPYPQAVAGTIASYSFDPATTTFTLSYAPDHTIPEPSVIYVNNRLYPQDSICSLSETTAKCTFTTPGYIEVSVSAPTKTLTVTVKPR